LLKFKITLLAIFIAVGAYAQKQDNSKPKTCEPLADSLKVFSFLSEGAIISEPALGISYFEGHESDSIDGFIRCGKFRKAIMVHGPEPLLIIHSPGTMVLKGGMQVKVEPELEETVIYYKEGDNFITMYTTQMPFAKPQKKEEDEN